MSSTSNSVRKETRRFAYIVFELKQIHPKIMQLRCVNPRFIAKLILP